MLILSLRQWIRALAHRSNEHGGLLVSVTIIAATSPKANMEFEASSPNILSTWSVPPQSADPLHSIVSDLD